MTRLRCCVPFCRRTRAPDGFDEWICQEHWSAVPKVKRRVWTRLKREARRTHPEYWKLPPHSPERLAAYAFWLGFHRIWRRLKAIAIEKAAGIA